MKLEQNVIFSQSLIPLIGMSLALVGVSIGMYLNHFFPIIKWSPIVMLISFLFSVNWKFYHSFPYFLIPNSLGYISLFVFLLLILILYNDGLATTPFSHMFFVFAFCFALTTHKNNVNYDFFPRVLFLVSLPCLVCGVVVCNLNMVLGVDTYYERLENELYALEPFSVAMGALINMFSMLCMKKTKIESFLFIFLLIGGLYVLSSCEKRTPLFVFIIGSLYYCYSKGFSFDLLPKKIVFGFTFVFGGGLISYLFIPLVSDRIDKFCFEMYAGVLNLFGNTSVRDTTGSAIMRAESREFAYEFIRTRMEWINYFIGMGYNKIGQLDNPILQIFVEAGIWGVFGYIGIIVVYPLTIIKKKFSNMCIILCILLSFYAILSIINSGNPYVFSKYTPVCILTVVVFYYKNRGEYA